MTMTPDQIRALGFEPHVPGEPCPVDQGTRVHVLLENGCGSSTGAPLEHNAAWVGWGATLGDGNIIGWRYADPADAQRAKHEALATKDAEIARLRELCETADRKFTVAAQVLVDYKTEIARLQEFVLAVVGATRAYLPPDGIDAQGCINRILQATDNPTINPIIERAEHGRS
jgi:hypothetical protein